MKFKLTPLFSERDIQKATDEFLNRAIKITQNELMKVGLDFVTAARQKTKSEGGFDDQTGNLRSSIGFILTYDGAIIHEDFEASSIGTDKATGLQKGRDLAKENVNTKGWGIITVAGMEYALSLEARGFDVIIGSTLGAEKKLQEALNNVARAFK